MLANAFRSFAFAFPPGSQTRGFLKLSGFNLVKSILVGVREVLLYLFLCIRLLRMSLECLSLPKIGYK